MTAADACDGGTEGDEVDYSGSPEAVHVNLSTGTGSGSSAEGDTCTSIENVTGSAVDVSITDDATENALDGGGSDDTVMGGADNDVLVLSAFCDDIRELHANQIVDVVLNQPNDGVDEVDYFDKTRFGPGDSLTFSGAVADGSFFTVKNTGVVCFVRGTRILTPDGEIEIQKLRAGNEVITQDNGPQKIRWVGSSPVPLTKNLQPIRIARGALGDGIPNCSLFVSPQRRMLIRSDIVEQGDRHARNFRHRKGARPHARDPS